MVTAEPSAHGWDIQPWPGLHLLISPPACKSHSEEVALGPGLKLGVRGGEERLGRFLMVERGCPKRQVSASGAGHLGFIWHCVAGSGRDSQKEWARACLEHCFWSAASPQKLGLFPVRPLSPIPSMFGPEAGVHPSLFKLSPSSPRSSGPCPSPGPSCPSCSSSTFESQAVLIFLFVWF